jgi:DNA-binding IclR family transcriptional regulator
MPAISATIVGALRVLSLFSSESLAWTASDIAQALGISYSKANRYVNSLKVAGLLQQVDGKIWLSPRLLYLAELVRSSDLLIQAATPVVDAIAWETGETVILSRLIERSIVGVLRRESRRVVRYSFEPGQPMPLNAGAAAKAILAYLDPKIRDRLLQGASWDPLTSNTITDEGRFLRELEEVRRQGYAMSCGEVEEGVVAFAAPLLLPWDEVCGSLCVVVPSYRLNAQVEAQVLAAVRKGAGEIITRYLGSQSAPIGARQRSKGDETSDS